MSQLMMALQRVQKCMDNKNFNNANMVKLCGFSCRLTHSESDKGLHCIILKKGSLWSYHISQSVVIFLTENSLKYLQSLLGSQKWPKS